MSFRRLFQQVGQNSLALQEMLNLQSKAKGIQWYTPHSRQCTAIFHKFYCLSCILTLQFLVLMNGTYCNSYLLPTELFLRLSPLMIWRFQNFVVPFEWYWKILVVNDSPWSQVSKWSTIWWCTTAHSWCLACISTECRGTKTDAIPYDLRCSTEHCSLTVKGKF